MPILEHAEARELLQKQIFDLLRTQLLTIQQSLALFNASTTSITYAEAASLVKAKDHIHFLLDTLSPVGAKVE